MADSLNKYLEENFIDLSKESKREFLSLFKEKSFPKGTTLLSAGKIHTNFFLIKEGLVASFINHSDGSNFIRTIYTKHQEIASLNSIIKNEPSNANYNCLVDCKVFEASYLEFFALRKHNPEFNLLYIKALEKIYLESEKRINELASLDASQRYLKLKNDISNIDNLLPQYQIANYLNITPVQLSRIRKKIFSK